ncbi:hypothetical protein [Trinickia sp.]|uniref:hypothetical protein n=1 Tax=Trinickia sp. TaxID=2571163 RepID=UPI003F80A129
MPYTGILKKAKKIAKRGTVGKNRRQQAGTTGYAKEDEADLPMRRRVPEKRRMAG